MKILYVISDRNIGGAGIQLLNILRHLDRREFAITVAVPFQSRLRERLLAMRVRVRELENPCEELTLRAVRELMCVIREEQPDIVPPRGAGAAGFAIGTCRRGAIYGLSVGCCASLPSHAVACERFPGDRDFLSRRFRGDERGRSRVGQRLRRKP